MVLMTIVGSVLEKVKLSIAKYDIRVTLHTYLCIANSLGINITRCAGWGSQFTNYLRFYVYSDSVRPMSTVLVYQH